MWRESLYPQNHVMENNNNTNTKQKEKFIKEQESNIADCFYYEYFYAHRKDSLLLQIYLFISVLLISIFFPRDFCIDNELVKQHNLV